MSTKPWQVVKSNIKFKKGQDRLVGMVKPDIHTSFPGDKKGGKSERAWQCFLEAVKVVKPDFLVDIGDAGEWLSVCHWEFKRVGRPPLKYVLRDLFRDVKYVEQDFRTIEKIVPKGCQLFAIQGNHDQWVDNLVYEMEDEPEITKDLLFHNLMKLKENGWKYFEHGKWAKFGKLYLSHGTTAKGVHHLRNMVLRHSCNVMYGHVHDMGCVAVGSLGGVHKAFSVGCLADMNKPFLRGDMTNWEHGFCLIDLKRNGNFQVQQIPIYSGECKVYGKIIKV